MNDKSSAFEQYLKNKLARTQFELLLPVGKKEMAEAAIHHGADAIFLGMPFFNARGRSHDFSLDELREIIEMCHLYGVKVNIAFNILIFESEWSEVLELLPQVLNLKPDAFIVQDLGLVETIRQLAPDQKIHASTQMTVTNDLAIRFVEDLNIQRFVLGRENSLHEIKLIAQKTPAELEVFVHGALCVSYSGQCFTSETVGGRSANRGQCAQSCRLSYEMYVDDKKHQEIDEKFLVSPQDLCGIAEIPELMSLGVKSFKVEGRLKSPEYVAQVAESFDRAIQAELAKTPLNPEELKTEKLKMAIPYSRGFFPGWLHGVDHQRLVDGNFNSHRGAQWGKIVEVIREGLRIQPINEISVEPGDGVLWASGGKETESGSFVYSVKKEKNGTYLIGIENSKLKVLVDEFANTEIEVPVYLNSSKAQSQILLAHQQDRRAQRKIPIQMKVLFKLNEPVQIELTDGHYSLKEKSEALVATANKRAVDISLVKDEFQSLGGTVFTFLSDNDLEIEIPQNIFFPSSELKKLRQKAYQSLTDLRKSQRVPMFDLQNKSLQEEMDPSTVDFALASSTFLGEGKQSSRLTILLRDKFQVRTLCEAVAISTLARSEIEAVILDFEFGRDYQDSLQLLKKSGLRAGLATTRVLKPKEYQNLKHIYSLNPDLILVRNLGAIEYFRNAQVFQGSLWGDFSLNVANSKTANYLLRKGLEQVTLSYDLNQQQVSDVLVQLKEKGLAHLAAVTIHQSMPSFHMEHCVFAAFLSEGSSYRDCGKPCEKHQVKLKDQLGNWHHLKPDQECRNTMYNATAQTALAYLSGWQEQGLSHVRFEAVAEQGQDLVEKIQLYLNSLSGRVDAGSVLKQIAVKESYGLSDGSFARAHEYQSRKQN
jgi:putative protease